MKSVISSIAIYDGTKTYELGQNINGLVIDHIMDDVIDINEIAYVPRYIGITKDGITAFVLENAPVEIVYQAGDFNEFSN